MRKRRKWTLAGENHLDFFFSFILSCLKKSTIQNPNVLGIFYTQALYSGLISAKITHVSLAVPYSPGKSSPLNRRLISLGCRSQHPIWQCCKVSISHVANQRATRTILAIKREDSQWSHLTSALLQVRRELLESDLPRKALLQELGTELLVQLSSSLQGRDWFKQWVISE